MKALLSLSLACLMLICMSRVAIAEENNYKVIVDAKVFVMPCKRSQHMHVKTTTTFTVPDGIFFSAHGVGEILGRLLDVEVHERCKRIVKNQEGSTIVTESHFCITEINKLIEALAHQGGYILLCLASGGSVEATIELFLPSANDGRKPKEPKPPKELKRPPEKVKKYDV